MGEVLDELRHTLEAAPVSERGRLLEAVTATCLLMARADGVVSPEELERIGETLGQMSDLAELERIDDHLDALWQDFEKRGLDVVLAEIAERLPVGRPRALAVECAAAVAFADGHYDFEEEVLLQRIATAFGLGEDETRTLVLRAAEA